MNKRIIKTIVLTLVITYFSVFTNAGSAIFAQTIRDADYLKFDSNLADSSQQQFALPSKIYVSQIDSPVHSISNSEDWISLLYYYFITRLNFADLPYNYIIDEQGIIYEGHKGGDAVIPELADPEGAILVGYLSTNSELTLSASESLDELVSSKSAKYGIPKENVSTVDLSIQEGGATALSKFSVSSTSNSAFLASVNTVLNKTSFAESDALNYEAEISELTYDSEVELASRFTVKLNITNTGDDPWFTFNDFIYVATASGEDSAYSINQVWDAFDKPTHIENVTLLPQESTPIEFEMQAPFEPGVITETFVLERENGSKVQNSEFTIELNVNAGDVDAVRILETGSGFLNVRSAPSTSSTVIGQVDIGAVFLFTASQDGWYRIRYDGDREGWIFGQYAQEL